MPQKRVTFRYFTPTIPTRKDSVRQLIIAWITIGVIMLISGWLILGTKGADWHAATTWITVGALGIITVVCCGYYLIQFLKERRRDREALLHPTNGSNEPALVLTDAGIHWYRQDDRRGTLIEWSAVQDIELAAPMSKSNPVYITYVQDGRPHTLQFINGQLDWQSLNVYNTLRQHWAKARAAANGHTPDTDDEAFAARRSRMSTAADDVVYRFKTVRLLSSFLILCVLAPVVTYFVFFKHASANGISAPATIFFAFFVFLCLATGITLFQRLRANNQSQPPLTVSSRGLAIHIDTSPMPPLVQWHDITDITRTDITHIRIDYDTEPDGIVRSVILDTSTYRNGETIFTTLTDRWKAVH